MAMRDQHRMFLQALMSRGILNANDVFKLLESCCERYEEAITDRRQLLLSFVHLLNDHIRVFGMEIKKVVDETDGSSYYGLVNTTETSITLLASTYTDNELQFFKKLVEKIVLSDAGTVGSMAACNISDALTKKMSKNDADYLLDRFAEDKWIGKMENGRVYLGTRGFLELEQYIIDMYGDSAVRCNICKKLCIQGEICGTCDTKLHSHCANKFFKDRAVMKCPECKSPWHRDVNGTPQPSTSSADATSSSPPPSSATQTRKRKAR